MNSTNLLIKKIIKQSRKPPYEELLELIKTTPFTKIGEKYGVSDNAVRRWCKSYDLPYKKKDIKELLY